MTATEDGVSRSGTGHALGITPARLLEVLDPSVSARSAAIQLNGNSGRARSPAAVLDTPVRYTRLAGTVQVLVGAALLSGPAGDVVVSGVQFWDAVVGLGLSLMLFSLGWLGGKALAAVQLPVQLVAALFVVAAIWIAWRTTTAASDASQPPERWILVMAMLSSVYVAALTSYAASIGGVPEHAIERHEHHEHPQGLADGIASETLMVVATARASRQSAGDGDECDRGTTLLRMGAVAMVAIAAVGELLGSQIAVTLGAAAAAVLLSGGRSMSTSDPRATTTQPRLPRGPSL
jgi:hypothetical protein